MTEPEKVTSFVEGFLEYTSADGEYWRVEDGGGLRALFGIHGSDEQIGRQLAAWQEFMAVQEPFWDVVRRRFGVHLLIGENNPDELRAWPAAELAAQMGLPVVEIEATEEAAAKSWRLHGAAPGKLPTKTEPVIEETAAPTGEAAAVLLRRYGFTAVEDEQERDYMALRCLELSEVLENDGQRALCRGMIQAETFLTFIIDPAIRSLRDAIKAKSAVQHDCTKENKQLMELMGDRRRQVESMEKTLAAMGISEKQTNAMRRKSDYQDSVGFLLEAIRTYCASEDSSLIDGVHRAAEVEVLVTPFIQRPPQYRPDLTFFVVPAAVAGLWDENFVMPKVGRAAHRALTMGLREGLRQARGETGATVADLEEERADVLLDEAERQEPAALPASMRAHPAFSNPTTHDDE